MLGAGPLGHLGCRYPGPRMGPSLPGPPDSNNPDAKAKARAAAEARRAGRAKDKAKAKALSAALLPLTNPPSPPSTSLTPITTPSKKGNRLRRLGHISTSPVSKKAKRNLVESQATVKEV